MRLPADPAAVLLWSEVLFIWTASSYPIRIQNSRLHRFTIPAQAFSATLVVWFLARDLPLAVSCLCLIIMAIYLRQNVAERYWAEVEVGSSIVFVVVSGTLITHRGLGVIGGVFEITGSEHMPAVLWLSATLSVFVVRGGTFVVRGLLDKAQVLPQVGGSEAAAVTDMKEVNRGRLIGDLERLLLMVVVAAGSYEALGFLIAAKGLIRSRELEQREWAEYFLIGTLASTAVALGAGMILGRAWKWAGG